jgi:hypothetical protein
MRMSERRLIVVPTHVANVKPPPVCDACDRSMWWHGSTEGWGCPDIHGGSPGCRSSLYRPKPDAAMRWSYAKRYPELKDGSYRERHPTPAA